MPREWIDKTCEDCEFMVKDRCRRQIGDYGYRQVASHGKFVMACSFWSKLVEEVAAPASSDVDRVPEPEVPSKVEDPAPRSKRRIPIGVTQP